MLKKYLLLSFLFIFSLTLSYFNIAQAATMAERLNGKILLQVQSHGEAWYVNPQEKQRIYLKDGDVAYGVMSRLGLGITNANLKKIPTGVESRFACTDNDNDGLCNKLEEGLGTDMNDADTDNDGFADGVEVKNNYDPLSTNKNKLVFDYTLVNSLKGKVLLQVQLNGQAWYLNPSDGKKYYMPDGPSAYQIMRFLSLGITNQDLSQIPISSFSVTPPTNPSDSQSPSAPSNLVATVNSTQITLTWSASTDNVGVSQYSIERSLSATTGFAPIASSINNSYLNSGLSANTTYYYRVRAQDAAGNFSGYSNIVNKQTGQLVLDTQAPTIPSNLTATATSTQITLAWRASTDNIAVTQYQIERSINASSGFSLIHTISTTSYLNTGLSANTTYYYRVRAQDAAGNFSAYSNIVSATTPNSTVVPVGDTQAPTVPTNLVATATSTQINLSWTAATDNTAVTGYQIFRSTTNGSNYSQIATNNINSYPNTGLTAGNTYYYIVKAFDAAGNISASSTQAQATVPTNVIEPQLVSVIQPYLDKIVVGSIIAPENTSYTWYKNNVQVESGNSATTFLAHFDGNLQTVNNENPVAQSGISYANAKFGQGMKGKAEYPVANNLSFTEGTIEFWLTLDQALSSSVYSTAGGDQYIFKYINSSNNEKIMMNIKNDLPALVFTVHSGNDDVDWSEAVQINTSYNDILANVPVLLSMTYSKSDNKSSLYLNGFKISQHDFNFNFATANGNLIIGNNYAVVDEFRILNRSLSAEEIMNNYVRGVPFNNNEIYYSGTKNVNDNLQLGISLQGSSYTANSQVKSSKINNISPNGYVLSNRSSINLSFNTVSNATCHYGKSADDYNDLPYTASGSGTSHSINYAVNTTVSSHDFYIKCQSGSDGDDYAFYRRLRVLPNINNNWPKVSSVTWGNNIVASEVAGLAKYDMISLAKDNVPRTSLLTKIKEANEQIVLLPYVNAPDNNIFWGISSFVHQDLFEKLSDTWRLRNAQGQYVTNLHFPNVMNYNLLASLPWAETLSKHVEDEIISRGNWDGVWYDVVDTNFWWLYNYNINRFTQYPDFDLDGVNEDLNINADYNKSKNIWINGMAEVMSMTRQKMGSDSIIVGNNGDANAQLYNGKMWERFLYYHESGFTDNLNAFLDPNNQNSFTYWNNNTVAPHLNWNMFEIATSTANYDKIRLGLAGSLLGSVYYNPANRSNYREILWFDEYWVDWDTGQPTTNAGSGRGYLGQPVSDPYIVSTNIWRRDFQHGIVVLNNSTTTAKIDLGQKFRYIEGKQDILANPGGLTQELNLAPRDARILLTTAENDPLIGLAR